MDHSALKVHPATSAVCYDVSVSGPIAGSSQEQLHRRRRRGNHSRVMCFTNQSNDLGWGASKLFSSPSAPTSDYLDVAAPVSANTRRSPKVGSMLGQRRRRWTNIGPALCSTLWITSHILASLSH